MYNLITLIVYFHCPTCFEPLIWVHLQGHIIGVSCVLGGENSTVIQDVYCVLYTGYQNSIDCSTFIQF
jgi:hypothetical protein